MPKRRVKKTVKQPAVAVEEAQIEKEANTVFDQEVERQIAAIRTIRDGQIEDLVTGLYLLRSSFSKEQLETPPLSKFLMENFPNLSFTRNEQNGQLEMQLKDTIGNLPDGKNIDASLFHHMSLAFTDAAIPSCSGFEFSSRAVKSSIVCDDGLQTGHFGLEEPFDAQMLGLQDTLSTPGVTSQRFSVGMTPKTVRLPKHGEMLLSVHGSPLGIYKEDNMEAIRESEEG